MKPCGRLRLQRVIVTRTPGIVTSTPVLCRYLSLYVECGGRPNPLVDLSHIYPASNTVLDIELYTCRCALPCPSHVALERNGSRTRCAQNVKKQRGGGGRGCYLGRHGENRRKHAYTLRDAKIGDSAVRFAFYMSRCAVVRALYDFSL